MSCTYGPDSKLFTLAKPTTKDILGCNSGPFANPAGGDPGLERVVPRLCAAFNRGTLLLNDPNDASGQHTEPFSQESMYYTGTAYNKYCKAVHDALNPTGSKNVSGGYCFSYDDNYGGATNPADVLQTDNATKLKVMIGGL
jgi:hypothetical protein